MDKYQGLFYLVSGAFSYLLLFFVMRLIGERKVKGEVAVKDDSLWRSKEKLNIVEIIDESHDVKTFRFKRDNGKGFSVFRPGQFLSFQIADDTKILRSYSISGSCENRSTLQVSIKKLKDGVGSGWFHQLKTGDSVYAFPPGGLFSDDELEAQTPRVYIGGGIGITPLISMIKTAVDRAQNAPMHLFYGMNSVKDLVFHEELLVLEKKYKNFKYFPILSPGATDWDGDTGYITYDYITSKMELAKNSRFYFCGPPIMTESIAEGLMQNGFDEEQIHSEKFASPAAFDPANIEAIDAKIEVNDEELDYSGKESILEFLESKQVNVAFACRSGVCGECKCKLIDGKVDSFTDSGLNTQEKKEGYFLSCVSRPKSNIKIEV